MNTLLQALSTHNIAWSVTPSKHAWSETSKRESPTLLMQVHKDGQVLSRHFHASVTLTVERMLAVLLKEQWPEFPPLRAWLDSKGNVPVALEPHALESLGECMHTALRKLADSKQSIITWNALHQMHSADRVALWDAVQAYLTSEFANEAPPTRRVLAKGLQDVVVASLEGQLSKGPTDKRGRAEKREPAERFALMAMLAACELTDIDEWMWGWLGYVVKDIETVSEPKA